MGDEERGDDEANPLAFLGLQRVGSGRESASKAVADEQKNVELNRRGLPARKRKKNSLIFGDDDLVTIPVKSPSKKRPPSTTKPTSRDPSEVKKTPTSVKKDLRSPRGRAVGSPVKTPVRNSPVRRITFSSPKTQTRSNAAPRSSSIRHRRNDEFENDDDSEGDADDDDKIEDKRLPQRMMNSGSRPSRNRADRRQLDLLSSQNGRTNSHKSVDDPSDDGGAGFDEDDEQDDSLDDVLPPVRNGAASTMARSSAYGCDRPHQKTPQKGIGSINNASGYERESRKGYNNSDQQAEYEDYHRLGLNARGTPERRSADREHSDNFIVTQHSAQRLGVALRNLLKLPKAYKWVCFEFFYSNIDKVLFEGGNDFMMCLTDSFPQLKTRMLTRVEWCKIRRLMGKPRRCSEAFFQEERDDLARKRERIRLLQQGNVTDLQMLKDLPDEIPLQLTIGSKVTARLRSPQDGLFTGVVEGVDTCNNTYRITFDRPGLGTHSIPDFEVLSSDPPDLLPLSNFLAKPRERPLPSLNGLPSPAMCRFPGVGPPAMHSPLTNDPLLSGSTPKTKSIRLDQVLGGYPVKFLYHIVKLNKCLKIKRDKVDLLRQLNCEAENKKCFGDPIDEDFQKKYASIVIEIYKTNEELNSQLRGITEFTAKMSNDEGPRLSLPDQIRQFCQEESYDMINNYNSSLSGESRRNAGEVSNPAVQSPSVLALITQLSALMLQIKRVAGGERNAAELQAIKDTLEDTKASLCPDNLKIFQDQVEVHLHHIQQGLTQMGNLTAFMSPDQL